ncbi:MAG TPA: prolyl oligopeptidase family serine peptidase, partial [Pirellulaceae bacterium]|nr:prolyl oligopeptidase family serine peptidase [Pirellulaceae bacterium]
MSLRAVVAACVAAGVAMFSSATADMVAAAEPSADLEADVAIFAKGVEWAKRYEPKIEGKDAALVEKATALHAARRDELAAGKSSWTARKGKVARGYKSKIDGSVQPYGMIVPSGYDAAKPWRLDVVLHGSTRPVGLSELRFIDRFEAGEQPGPDVPYLELHPLGRVENGYRWAGETDVYEAIEAACRQYSIDRKRIVLRGMSMGASGTWHLGLKNPGRFVALGPYCGYVDTHRFSETPLPNFIRVGQLPEVQEKMLHMLDSVDYAANAGIVPAIACMGEKDVFFDAHVIMGAAMEREGLKMVNLISPGTGHVVDPKTHGEQMGRIATYVEQGLNERPERIRFVTWTLKYPRAHWLEVRGMEKHYERAEVVAQFDGMGKVVIEKATNVTKLAIHTSIFAGNFVRVVMGGRTFKLVVGEDQRRVEWLELSLTNLGWDVARDFDPITKRPIDKRVKRPGVQGPIDDAFTSPFLCVRGTGKPWNDGVDAWAKSDLARLSYEWHRYFRGELPVKNDTDVTDDDRATKNLILFGDPGSNSLIAESLRNSDLKWSRTEFQLAGKTFSAADHAPVLITASPLRGAEGRYLVINSGHSFHEKELASLNYLLYPRLGDWAVKKVAPP